MRITWLFTLMILLGALPFASCSNGGTTSDDGLAADVDMRAGRDMRHDLSAGGPAVTCDGSIGPRPDATVAPNPIKINTGDIGQPCKADMDCKQGSGKPICWVKNLFNSTMYIPTAGGYCTVACNVDADCGSSDHICTDFGMVMGKPAKYCLGGCNDAVTCRHPGYACAYIKDLGNGMVATACFPAGAGTILDCNPKTGDCTDRQGNPGACQRAAIEDDNGGICLTRCDPGVGNCQPDNSGNNQQCLYDDYTGNGDAFRGTVCIASAMNQKNPGDACKYGNECPDGYQCDNGADGTKTCLKMCRIGKKSPACGTGTSCQDVFGLCATNAAGLCRAQ